MGISPTVMLSSNRPCVVVPCAPWRCEREYSRNKHSLLGTDQNGNARAQLCQIHAQPPPAPLTMHLHAWALDPMPTGAMAPILTDLISSHLVCYPSGNPTVLDRPTDVALGTRAVFAMQASLRLLHSSDEGRWRRKVISIEA